MAILEKGEGTFLKITTLKKNKVTCWNGDFESRGNNLLKITTLKIREWTFWNEKRQSWK